MTRLRLGIGAKVSILVSRLHPKNLISKAYANYTKTDKAEGLVVVSESPKLIRREEKVVVVFHHPPKGNLTEEFECWAIHRFAHITEEGNEEDVFMSSRDGGSNNSGGVGVLKSKLSRTDRWTFRLRFRWEMLIHIMDKPKTLERCQWGKEITG